MLEVDTPYDMESHVGKKIGTSDWLLIDQERINDFARITGDENWIHVDVERAKRELPNGFSLLPYLGGKILNIRERSRGVNYGSNKLRFTAPVQVGSRIRLHRTLVKYEVAEGGARLTFSNEIEIEGSARPALVAETISMMYAKGK